MTLNKYIEVAFIADEWNYVRGSRTEVSKLESVKLGLIGHVCAPPFMLNYYSSSYSSSFIGVSYNVVVSPISFSKLNTHQTVK